MTTLVTKTLVCTALMTLLVTSCSPAPEQVSITDPWVRLNPPGSAMTAGYGTLVNDGTESLTLHTMSSSRFGNISLHQTVEVDGKARMRTVEELTLTPNEQLVMVPGGYHLMLMKARSDLQKDEQIEITFEFVGGYQTTMQFIVRQP